MNGSLERGGISSRRRPMSISLLSTMCALWVSGCYRTPDAPPLDEISSTGEDEPGSTTALPDDSASSAASTEGSGDAGMGSTGDSGESDGSGNLGDSGGSTTGDVGCPDGEQDNDGNGECVAACDADRCGEHGSCDDSSGVAECVCDPEYDGDACELCGAGFQDNDGDGLCVAACVADSCNGHGSCDDSSGIVECLCTGPYSGDTCDVCILNPLLDDPFDNGDIGSGGPAAIGGGFIYADNGPVTDGSLGESMGIARVTTPTPGNGAEPNVGGYSVGTFDGTLPEGITLMAEVSSADTPMWHGIAFTLNGDPGFYELAGRPGLEFHVFGSSISVEADIQSQGDEVYATASYDADALGDGFTLALTASPTGWSYTVEGLMLDGSALTGSGGWTPGYGYGDLLDAVSHTGFGIQGDNTDAIPRVLDIERVTVFGGTCDPGDLPAHP